MSLTLVLAVLSACDDGGGVAGPRPVDAARDARADAALDAERMDAERMDAERMDAEPMDAAADAEPTACEPLEATGATDLVLSEIVPGSSIELYNPTTEDVDLATAGHFLCSPFIYEALADSAPGVVPAGGYLTIDWPFTAGTSAANAASGELILYESSDFPNGDAMVDFVCWGMRPTMSRKTLAGVAGLFAGDCAEAITGGSLQRLTATTGLDADSYDGAATPTPRCVAP